MVHAGYVFVVGIHSSSTWMSGSLESVRWNACVHGPDLGLYSHPKEFGGNGVRTHVNPKGKISSTGGSEGCQTATLHHVGQRAQHTTDWAIPAKLMSLTTTPSWAQYLLPIFILSWLFSFSSLSLYLLPRHRLELNNFNRDTTLSQYLRYVSIPISPTMTSPWSDYLALCYHLDLNISHGHDPECLAMTPSWFYNVLQWYPLHFSISHQNINSNWISHTMILSWAKHLLPQYHLELNIQTISHSTEYLSP